MQKADAVRTSTSREEGLFSVQTAIIIIIINKMSDGDFKQNIKGNIHHGESLSSARL